MTPETCTIPNGSNIIGQMYTLWSLHKTHEVYITALAMFTLVIAAIHTGTALLATNSFRNELKKLQLMHIEHSTLWRNRDLGLKEQYGHTRFRSRWTSSWCPCTNSTCLRSAPIILHWLGNYTHKLNHTFRTWGIYFATDSYLSDPCIYTSAFQETFAVCGSNYVLHFTFSTTKRMWEKSIASRPDLLEACVEISSWILAIKWCARIIRTVNRRVGSNPKYCVCFRANTLVKISHSSPYQPISG